MMTTEERITNLKNDDTVGITDGIDLENLSEEDLCKLEEEVFRYNSSRTAAWTKDFEKKQPTDKPS